MSLYFQGKQANKELLNAQKKLKALKRERNRLNKAMRKKYGQAWIDEFNEK